MIKIGVFLMSLGLGYYAASSLQWFGYKLERAIFHHTRPVWHLYFLLIPVCLFMVACVLEIELLGLGVAILYILALFIWQKSLSHKLIFTPKIKRFFGILLIFAVFSGIFANEFTALFYIFMNLLFTILISNLIEMIIWQKFKNKATQKLALMPNLKVILITASYGKTSMKNFLFHLLKDDFSVYKTPRSVNTITGILKDINENLPTDTQIYIAEAGAREKGDIADIAKFLSPQLVIIGEIGLSHIEYFKDIKFTRQTKLEALESKRLEMAFVHSSTLLTSGPNIRIYDQNITNVSSDLNGICFEMQNEKFQSNLLGKFNAQNLAAVISVAKFLQVENLIYKVQNLPSVEHRLQKIQANGKFIIDDSFNGNFNGMKTSYELAKTYQGRKVLLTPGIMEGDKSQNIELSKIINDCFDLVVITSRLNEKELKTHLNKPKVLNLFDKNDMQNFLAKNTEPNDLILFSNDAPSFM